MPFSIILAQSLAIKHSSYEVTYSFYSHPADSYCYIALLPSKPLCFSYPEFLSLLPVSLDRILHFWLPYGNSSWLLSSFLSLG